ncbi:hypothetical protein [Telluribacter sp. SYSU D00476]|uniref:hypothetical protein n=1 Tax=Telluribacter sp. SYSU D00476 TaxID=2811430 RepID=UPI001FF61B5D|nr:hypothetical protein [Telluribacter sp. SYSU D00476]
MRTIVLYDNPATPEELSFLNSVFESVGHPAEDITLVPYRWLMSFNQAEVFVSLGVPLSKFMYDLQSSPYEETKVGNSTFLLVDPLDKLVSDNTRKKRLWHSLQGIYLSNIPGYKQIDHPFLLDSGFTVGRRFDTGSNRFTLYYQMPGTSCTIELHVGSRLLPASSPEEAVEEYSDMDLLIAHAQDTYTVYGNQTPITTIRYRAELMQLLSYMADGAHPTLQLAYQKMGIPIPKRVRVESEVAA